MKVMPLWELALALALAALCVSSSVRASAVVDYTSADEYTNSADDGNNSEGCKVSEWAYSACEDGEQLRTRNVVQEPADGAWPCPLLEELVPCEPIPCAVSEWTPLSTCDAVGYKTRTRQVITPSEYGGVACPRLVDRVPCIEDDCRVCAWSDWSCDAYTGNQTRVRHVVSPPRNDGQACPHLREEKPCDAVDCVLDPTTFVPTAQCDSVTGTQPFALAVLQAPLYGGQECLQQTELRTCAVDCDVSAFSPWSACDAVTGLRNRSRTETVTAKNGGRACPPLYEEEACPVPCQMSDFCDWSACDAATGMRSRSRQVVVRPLNGGDACPLNDVETEDCAVDCVVAYSNWTECAPYAPTQSRSGTVVVEAKNGGRACPSDDVLAHEERACEPTVDCVCKWGKWGKCVNGFQYRSRKVSVAPTHGGKSCPPIEKRKQRRPCVVDVGSP